MARLLVVILGFLFYWLLGFIVSDIGDWPGPQYADLEREMLDPGLLSRRDDLREKIDETKREIDQQTARQELLRDSTSNSQQTMNQLLEIRKLSLEKNVAPSAEEQAALEESQQRFLTNQAQYQQLNEDIVRLNEQLRQLEEQSRAADQELATLREPVTAEYQRQSRAHSYRMAAYKLLFLTPLLVLAGVLVIRIRGGLYTSLVYALGIAILVKVGWVMHEHFPAQYFKYILIVSAIAVSLLILVVTIRAIAFPSRDWLLKQYREAYEALMCPVCSFPIRRGPLKYMIWTKRSLRKLAMPAADPSEREEVYTCPSCSTRLYESCPDCNGVRASLLPACSKCGAVKDFDASAST
jgi:hypothetical protein